VSHWSKGVPSEEETESQSRPGGSNKPVGGGRIWIVNEQRRRLGRAPCALSVGKITRSGWNTTSMCVCVCILSRNACQWRVQNEHEACRAHYFAADERRRNNKSGSENT
jgi:hypothetical protein